jgi:membrane-associated progesterone receptor component
MLLTLQLAAPTFVGRPLAPSPLSLSPPPEPRGSRAVVADVTVVDVGLGLAGGTTIAVVSYGLWVKSGWDRVAAIRARKAASAPAKRRGLDPASPSYIRPRELWRASELAAYDGSASDDGPILLAADGIVFNVARGRNFYGPSGEYAVMAGRDASRYLASNSVEEDAAGPEGRALNVAERASLGVWVATLRSKYDEVGRLASAEDEAELDAVEAKRVAYAAAMDRLNEELLAEDAAAEGSSGERAEEVARRVGEAVRASGREGHHVDT